MSFLRRVRARARALPAVGCALLAWGCGGAVATEPAATPAAAGAPAARPRFVSPYSYEWFVRAELLEARGQHAAAAEAYRMAMADADDDPYLFARLALALDGAGDAAGAQHALAAGLQLDPHSEAVWLARARIARRHGALARAFEAYERAETAAPRSPDAPLELAQLLREHSQPERAVAVLERFAARSDAGSRAALQASIALALARGDGEALAGAVRQDLARDAGDAPLLRRTAAELLAQGRAALASRVLSVLPAAPEDARLRLAVALALEQRERVELLLRDTPPEALGGPLEMAEAYLRIGQPQRALALLEEADGTSDSDPHRGALLRGRALVALGRPAEAAAALAQIPRGSAYHARAVRALAQALQVAGLPALALEVEGRARTDEAGHPAEAPPAQ